MTNFSDIWNSLSNEEKAQVFEEMSRTATRLAIELAKQRCKTDYPNAGYFGIREKTEVKPRKVVITQTEVTPEKVVTKKEEIFYDLRNEDFEKDEKKFEKRRKELRKEMEKHFKLSQIADYYENDILDSYKESKICDEW